MHLNMKRRAQSQFRTVRPSFVLSKRYLKGDLQNGLLWLAHAFIPARLLYTFFTLAYCILFEMTVLEKIDETDHLLLENNILICFVYFWKRSVQMVVCLNNETQQRISEYSTFTQINKLKVNVKKKTV